MGVPDGDRADETTGQLATDVTQLKDVVVTAHTSAPDRTVLTERGNTDAWIASSLTIDCSR